MKPAPDLNIKTKYAAIPHGNDVLPLSKLAAREEDQRAEHFAFTPADRELLDKVLAEEDRAE